MAHPPAPERRGARSEWTIWGTSATIVVDDEDRLDAARALADEVLAAVTAACSRFDPHSELSRLTGDPALERGVEVSPLLASLVEAALHVAEQTDGSVDPSLGAELNEWGYDSDLTALASSDAHDTPGITHSSGFSLSVRNRREPVWQRIHVDGTRLSVPAGIQLDLGATAKAFAADLIARRAAAELGTAVLVSLGGDIATAGPDGADGWEILVQDLETDPAQQVRIPTGSAMATSSTQKRRWVHAGHLRQHIFDPAFGTPVVPVWRSATVAATTCLRANALSTAAIVRGRDAVAWLTTQHADARLVDLDGRVVTTGAWPQPADHAEPSTTGGAR